MSLSTRLIAFAAYALTVTAAFTDAIRELYRLSAADDSASHVVLVPLVSAALVFHDRRAVFTRVATATAPGLALIVAGLVLAGLAKAGAVSSPLSAAVAAMVVFWAGGWVLLFGGEAFRAARFPLFFLLFTIPPPALLLDGMTNVLKLGSTEAVAWLFTLTGTTVHRDGFVFALPTLTIEVADACSGIRSTIALTLTSLLAGHLSLGRTWTKLLLLAAVVPVTILKNAIRIVTLSLLATHVNPSFLTGRLHNDGGVAFFLMALALLAPVLTLLRRLETADDRTPAAKPVAMA
jgi:exosortase